MKSRSLLVLPVLLVLGLACAAALFLNQPARSNSTFACAPLADRDAADSQDDSFQPLSLTPGELPAADAPLEAGPDVVIGITESEAKALQPVPAPDVDTRAQDLSILRVLQEAKVTDLESELKKLIDEMPCFATISGTVLDQRGQPVAGASVRATFDPAVASPAEPAEGSRRRIRTTTMTLATTEADGSYTARVTLFVPAETGSITLKLSALHAAYIADAPLEITVNREETRTGIDLSMTLGATVKGTVRDAYGAPIEGAKVYAGAGQSAKRGGRSATIGSAVTDAQGQYVMQGLRTGEMWVSANATGYGPQDKGVDLNVTVGQEYLAPDITLAMQTALKFKVYGGEFSSGKVGVTITPIEGKAQYITANIGKDGVVLVSCRFSGQATLNVTTAGFGTAAPITLNITEAIHNDLGMIELVAMTQTSPTPPRLKTVSPEDQRSGPMPERSSR